MFIPMKELFRRKFDTQTETTNYYGMMVFNEFLKFQWIYSSFLIISFELYCRQQLSSNNWLNVM